MAEQANFDLFRNVDAELRCFFCDDKFCEMYFVAHVGKKERRVAVHGACIEHHRRCQQGTFTVETV